MARSVSDILGVAVPEADAVEVARALIPSGTTGGPLQQALMPEGLIKGQQRSISSQLGTVGAAVLTPEQAARIKASEDKMRMRIRGEAVLTPEQAARIEAAQRIPMNGPNKRPREM